MVKLYVPSDMASVALGADEVAGALAIEAAKRSLPIEIVRNGSRGLFSIEPLVEVETAEGRIGYGPVYPEEVAALVAAGLFDGAPHAKRYLFFGDRNGVRARAAQWALDDLRRKLAR